MRKIIYLDQFGRKQEKTVNKFEEIEFFQNVRQNKYTVLTVKNIE